MLGILRRVLPGKRESNTILSSSGASEKASLHWSGTDSIRKASPGLLLTLLGLSLANMPLKA